MITSSLDKLAKDFNVDNKGTFPVLFVNNNNIDLNYKGKVPPIESFVNLDFDKYIDYCKSFLPTAGKEWDLKLEAIKYCNQDGYNIVSNNR